ncbi:hypothetical protein ACNJYA_09745 [Bradyrhizobium sp. DASA03068]|uniref:hypothetical protein n=1 Tax=Bradyrhizobium sp. BLXBL-01 TaxID=3395915 RepID=UPI003F717FE4
MSASESQPTTTIPWFQPLSEPARPLTSEDVGKIRRDERHKASSDQAERARAAKDRDKRQMIAVIQSVARADEPAKRLLPRVNMRLRELGRKPISLSTLYRWLNKRK